MPDILDLPNEVLEMILEHVDERDMCNVRFATRQLHDNMQRRFCLTYFSVWQLNLTQQNMRNLVEASEHPAFQQTLHTILVTSEPADHLNTGNIEARLSKTISNILDLDKPLILGLYEHWDLPRCYQPICGARDTALFMIYNAMCLSGVVPHNPPMIKSEMPSLRFSSKREMIFYELRKSPLTGNVIAETSCRFRKGRAYRLYRTIQRRYPSSQPPARYASDFPTSASRTDRQQRHG